MSAVDVDYSEFWPLFRAYSVENTVPRFYARTIEPSVYEIFFNDQGLIVRTIAEDSGDVTDFEGKYQSAANAPILKRSWQDYLANGNDISLDVNGSGAAQEFTIGSNASATRVIKDFILYIEDGEMIFKEFGTVDALEDAERFDISHTIGSETVKVLPLSSTLRDISLSSGRLFTALDDVLRVNVRSSMDHYYTLIKPAAPIILPPSSSDEIKATVRANLNGLDEFWVKARGWELPL